MIRQLVPERPAAVELTVDPANPTGLVAAAAAVRGAAVAASGVILSAGLALIIWAVTPASGSDPGGALQGGVVAFASANLMPVAIGGFVLTLPPLTLTLLMVVLLASTARRGRFLPRGRYQEMVSVAVTAVVYGLVVAVVTRGFGPPDAVPAGWVWAAFAVALVATAAGMLGRGSAWRTTWTTAVQEWIRLAARGAGVGVAMLLAGGGLALTVGLLTHFGSAVAVAAIAAPSWSDGLGMAMLGLAYAPNAVIAATGYVTGVGFEIGPGTYSPLATTAVDLPAVPLLAAAPDQSGRSLIGLAFLVIPAVAGYLIARTVARRLPTRVDRMLSAGLAAVLTGVVLAVLAAIARGGVGDGRWSTMGAPPLLLGLLAAAEIGAVAVVASAFIGGRSVPWRAAEVDDGVERAAGSTRSTVPRADSAVSAVDVVDDEQDNVELADAEPVEQPAVAHEGEDDSDAAGVDEQQVDEQPADDAPLDEDLVDDSLVDDGAADEEPMSDADRFVDEARYTEEIDWPTAAEPAVDTVDDVATGDDNSELTSADRDAADVEGHVNR